MSDSVDRRRCPQHRNTTVVLYPAPGIGHVVAMVELAKLIRCHRPIPITILLTTGMLDTPALDSYIASASAANPYIDFLHFPPLSVPQPPPGTSVSHAALCFEFLRLNTAKHLLPALRGIPTAAVLVIDLFCASAIPVTRSLGLPTYYFYTSGASALACFLCFPEIFDRSMGSFKDYGKDVMIEFPGGLPPLKARHMPQPTLDREDPAFEDFRDFCSKLKDAHGILVNTFEELETTGVGVLVSGKCMPDSGTPPVYCIGPLIADRDAEPRPGVEHECLEWLDKQPTKSVVFLCFGSRGIFSALQIEQIAVGLEKSGHHFLWVVKPPPNPDGDILADPATGSGFLDTVLPPGFHERTKDRGMVVESWAPQVVVLRKEAVGGFVTHCGWNSTLEAIVAGVPMAAWPLYAEQHLNSNLMVEEMGVATGVGIGDDDEGIVSAAEVERAVRELMEEEERGKGGVKEKCLLMKAKASEAFAQFGSSWNNIEKLIDLWKNI